MVAGCGNKCVKYFFWLINFLFFILGAVILGLAIWMRVDPSSLFKLANNARIDVSRIQDNIESFYFALYGIMAIGALLLILGFLGCCGSACESLCAIGLYFVFVIALFVVKIVAIVLYFVRKDDIQKFLKETLKNEVVAKYNQPAMKEIMDALQQGMFCCGSYGCNDYYGTPAVGPPQTCPQPCNQFTPGCGPKLWQAIESNLLIVIVIVFAILVVELLAMILSCVMCGAVKDKRNQSY